ncbi:hypothetical protein BGZ80_002225 [Entomortierella chlamydospora]|uniref:PAS domain-containing protein n=1 Tax=Entomortierella chlamydospora TaxID=101097 RepID=A0A9P6MQM5_9FUNG|nr:hypothetical protein BGZ80_002225 [Entomortierella chlamydospora]
MYASPSCELILNIDPDDLLGKPLLLYIRADDLASFVEQADLAKSTATVRHLRFWFQSPNCRQEIPLEAIFLGAADAMIIIFRRCLPFRRRQFITDYSSQEYFTGRQNNKFSRDYNFSNRSNSRSRGSSFERTEHYGRYGYVHSIRGSPTDSLSSSGSTSSPRSDGTRAYQASLLNTYVGSINSIRSLDNEQTRIRPLASFHEDENVVDESKAQDMIRPVHTQDSEVETILVEGFEAIKLIPDRKKFIKREEDIEEGGHLHEDDNFGEGQGIMTVDESIEEIQMPYSIRRHRREE